MDLARQFLKQLALDLQQIPLQDLAFLPHNLNKLVMEVIQLIFNKVMRFMVARLAAMLVLAELEVTRALAKVTKTANMEAVTKASVATTMVTANNNVEDGVAITEDTNFNLVNDQ